MLVLHLRLGFDGVKIDGCGVQRNMTLYAGPREWPRDLSREGGADCVLCISYASSNLEIAGTERGVCAARGRARIVISESI